MSKLEKQIDKSFPIQWTYKGAKYGFSPSSLRGRIRCWFRHVPLTRKYILKWHDLSCIAQVIARIDNITSGKDMMHEMRERGFEL